jgi:hypothetical protein
MANWIGSDWHIDGLQYSGNVMQKTAADRAAKISASSPIFIASQQSAPALSALAHSPPVAPAHFWHSKPCRLLKSVELHNTLSFITIAHGTVVTAGASHVVVGCMALSPHGRKGNTAQSQPQVAFGSLGDVQVGTFFCWEIDGCWFLKIVT